ncbi:MAG: undecaprenyl-phosphate glucose phosphotransferase [Methylovirgula sp.]
MSYAQWDSTAQERRRAQGARHLHISPETVGGIILSIEGIGIVLSSLIGHVIFQSLQYHNLKEVDVDVAFGIGTVTAIIYVLIAATFGLYRLPKLVFFTNAMSKVVLAWTSSLLLITGILFLLKVGTVLSRGSIFSFALVAFAVLTTTRLAFLTFAHSLIAKGAMVGRPAIVIGEGSELNHWSATQLMLHFGVAEMMRDSLIANEISDRADSLNAVKLGKAVELARQTKAEEFIIAVRWSNEKLLEVIRSHLRNSPLSVRLVPDQFIRSIMTQRSASGAAFIPSVELQRAPMGTSERFFKRCFDLIVASLGLLVLSPLLVAVAIAIKLDSPGPVIFKQRRNGFDGRPFVIYKFRSMRVLEDGEQIAQAVRGDRRFTSIGAILRRTSIDELPQLFNVTKGDMSLIGPRPHALAHDNQYKRVIANYAHRHHVKPGITGWAQIHGCRGETKQIEQMIQRVEFDLWYINNWSIGLDLRILMRTCAALLSGDVY